MCYNLMSKEETYQSIHWHFSTALQEMVENYVVTMNSDDWYKFKMSMEELSLMVD